MPQTLLALCAILVFTFFAFGRVQDDASLERRTISAEIERALTDAARNRMAEIERKAFDEQDAGPTSGIRMAPSTSVIGRDAGETTVSLFDDIDDFNDLDVVLGGPERRAAPVDVALIAPALAAGSVTAGMVQYDLTVSVRYVDPLSPGVVSTVPTMAKEVVVTAREVTTGATGRPAAIARIRRLFTPAGMAAR